MVPEKTGGYTKYQPTQEEMSIFDAAIRYQETNTPLVIIAGKEYGTGSSRDWAAKGTRLLGVKAVIAESFERIHRSNLIGMGILPLEFKNKDCRKSLNLEGEEIFDIQGLDNTRLTPGMDLSLIVRYKNGETHTTKVLCRLDTSDEVHYYENGGILHYVLRNLLRESKAA